MSKKIRVSVAGATGYTGGELLTWLKRHRFVEIKHLTSESSAGKKIGDVIPALRHDYDLTLEKPKATSLAKDSDVVFTALPHGVGSPFIRDLVARKTKVVDLSADFRIDKAKLYEQWYKVKHAAPGLLKKTAYGLPELYRSKIRKAPLVANPGCYATTSILALTPLLRHKLIDPATIVVDAKSGVSGAGKKLALMYHYSETTENFQAYGVAHHRHMPEIEQVLGWESGRSIKITFVPHLVPMKRGILALAYAQLKKKMGSEEVKAFFKKDFGREHFIRILPGQEWPQTKNVTNTNYCDINVQVDERTGRVIVLAALDNLVKGASGQAIQNMNLLFGLKETEGLL